MRLLGSSASALTYFRKSLANIYGSAPWGITKDQTSHGSPCGLVLESCWRSSYCLPFFKLLLAFFSFGSAPADFSAFRFCPTTAATVLTLTSVDLPDPLRASFATCVSAVLQSADVSLIAYLQMANGKNACQHDPS